MNTHYVSGIIERYSSKRILLYSSLTLVLSPLAFTQKRKIYSRCSSYTLPGIYLPVVFSVVPHLEIRSVSYITISGNFILVFDMRYSLQMIYFNPL